MIYVVELSFPTQSRSPPEYITKRSLRKTEGSFFVKLPELHRREAATETCRGKRWRSDCRIGQTIVKRGLTVVKLSLMLKKHPTHVVPECPHRGSSVFESGL